MDNYFADILDSLMKVKRKNPTKSFTEILHLVGINKIDYSGSIVNNWTSSLKMKDNRTDTDEEILDRVTKYWLVRGGQKSETTIKHKEDGK
jgi:hypothetical protein